MIRGNAFPGLLSHLSAFATTLLNGSQESKEIEKRNDELGVENRAKACSYCLGMAAQLDGSYLRTFALELKEQLAQTLVAFVMSILARLRELDAEETAEPTLRQIIDLLQQVMCSHDAEKLAVAVLEICKGGS